MEQAINTEILTVISELLESDLMRNIEQETTEDLYDRTTSAHL